MNDVGFILALTSALGSGLVAGVFFAFSTFVMSALSRLPVAEGVSAMQSINRRAVTPAFMSLLFGTALLSLGLVVAQVTSPGDLPSGSVITASLLYLAGPVGVTVAFNVPWNNRLAAIDPDSGNAAEEWELFLERWIAWNHVRTIAALGASAVLTVTLAV